jgi:hypothetical protein
MNIVIVRARAHLLLAILEALDRLHKPMLRLAEQDARRLQMHMWRARTDRLQ